MNFIQQKLKSVVVIEPDVFKDKRGFFMESYNFEKFRAAGIHYSFVQDNHSHSMKGVIRGLHFQKSPYGQGKLVRVIKGAIFDVAVDINKDSPTFGEWVGVELSAENHRMLFIPPEYAHGFCCLRDNTDVLYKATAIYHPQAEAGIIWNDPDINIKWPDLDSPAIVSDKDQRLSGLNQL